MRALNAEHRDLDEVTDVLAFPMDGVDELPRGLERQLGDVVICFEQAERQAGEAGVETLAEVRTLVVHGLLHLLGHDHEADARRDARAAGRADRGAAHVVTPRARCGTVPSRTAPVAWLRAVRAAPTRIRAARRQRAGVPRRPAGVPVRTAGGGRPRRRARAARGAARLGLDRPSRGRGDGRAARAGRRGDRPSGGSARTAPQARYGRRSRGRARCGRRRACDGLLGLSAAGGRRAGAAAERRRGARPGRARASRTGAGRARRCDAGSARRACRRRRRRRRHHRQLRRRPRLRRPLRRRSCPRLRPCPSSRRLPRCDGRVPDWKR